MSIYWICLFPAVIWFAGVLFQADRLNSKKAAVAFDLAALLCFAAGIVLYRYHVFAEKRGFFIVVFAVPLIFLATFELFRFIYIALRHEGPCINVRSGRWIGDRPVDGFFTKYPENKVISWADVLFGISQWIVPLVIVMALFISSLAMNW